MLSFALKRFALAALILLVAVVLMFLMIRAVPGDPVQIMLGPRATPELQARLTAELALDQPIWRQLVIFYGNMLQGDLGTDVFSGRSVTQIVFQQLPFTLELIFVSIFLSAALGILLGAYAAAHPNTLIDRCVAVLSVSFVAAPAFVVALLSLLLFAVRLQWFSARRRGSQTEEEPMTETLLEIDRLSFDYETERGDLKALRDISFDVRKGEIVGIVGESGCGKSTLISSILRLTAPNTRFRQGEVRFKGQDLLQASERQMRDLRGDHISIVFQDPMQTHNPVLSVGRQMVDIQHRSSASKAEKRGQDAGSGRHSRP